MILELERFLMAAEEGNLTRTAEKIFITQSALTQSIKRLEKELGTRLFIQKGKYLELTDEGKAVQIIGNRILKLWENAKDPLLRGKTMPTVSIGMFDNAALRLGSFFKRQITDNVLRLELTIESSGMLFTRLLLGTIDLAVCVMSNKRILPRHIVLLKIFDEELIPVSSRLFSAKIEEIPFIFYNKHSYTREQTDAVFDAHAIKPTVFAESTSTTFMKELALLGSGVALLPANFVKTELKQGVLQKQPLELRWKRRYGLYSNINSTVQHDNEFIAELIKELKKAK